MIKIVTNIKDSLGKLFTQPKPCLYIEEDGFGEGVKGIIFGKTLHRHFKKYYWKDVDEINMSQGEMLDAIEFVFSSGKKKLIFNYDLNWDAFIAELPRYFPGFNMHNLKEAGKLVWGDLPCWKRGQTIGNLLIDSDSGKIIWQDNGSVFDVLNKS